MKMASMVACIVGVDIVADRFGFGGTAAAVGGAVAVVASAEFVVDIQIDCPFFRRWRLRLKYKGHRIP